MDIRSVTGRRLLSARMPDLGVGLDHAIAVRRTELHRLLLEAVAGVASVDTRFGCVAVSADPGGAVRLTSPSGSGPDLGSTSLRADVIVGADGVSSAVRNTGGFESRVSSGSSYVRSIVSGRASPWFEEYWTPLGSFGQAPLGGDLVYFWAAAHVGAAADAVARRDLGAFGQEWRRVLPAAADLLERVSSFDDLLVNTVRRVDCRRWFSGRLVLLGDAAHAMAPNLGQGREQCTGRRRGPSRGTHRGTIGAGCPGGLRQAPASTRSARADDGGDAATPVWHRAGHGPAPKGYSAGRIGPVSAPQ
jgi:2-polyprenyl-6-methoxyphenol hydroxylase-like FAD-dependent oxidoreductase